MAEEGAWDVSHKIHTLSGGDSIVSKKIGFDNLTKEEELFLHLLSFSDLKERYVVSDLLTEQGIQSVINCDLGYISRLIKRNEEKGFIYRTKMKIENRKRKQTVFFLTDDGIKYAKEINKLMKLPK